MFIAILAGCTPVFLPPESDEARTGDGDTGFVDGGSFADPGEAGGDVIEPPPLVPDEDGETATESFFLARAIDPPSEDSAGPKFVEVGDVDRDGFPDLVTGWNQSQVIQVHLQRRGADDQVTFESVQIAGTTPIAIVAGVKLADMDNDGWLDIVVLVKHQSFLTICPLSGEVFDDGLAGVVLILYSPGGDVTNGADWQEVSIYESLEVNPDPPGGLPPGLPAEGGLRAQDFPEEGGMTAMDVGDITGDGLPDIVITSNRPDDPCHPPGENDVELYPNPGPALARDGTSWPQVLVDRDAPPLKDLILWDIDGDDRLDVLFTRPSSVSSNISWRRSLGGTAFDFRRPIGMIDGGADIMTLGDVDLDGLTDVVVRSNAGKVIQWFRHPSPDDDLNVSDTLPPRPDIPWSVYTLLDLGELSPLGISLGDINFDNQPELLLGASGSVFWVDSSTAETVYDPWSANLIVDDAQLDNTLFAAQGEALINDLLVFDLDCDGTTDIVATMDRQSLSGLSNDVVIWFRNVLQPEDVGLDNAVLIPGCKNP
jgi:hypothetical protein